jgi:hypothetical protein
MKKAVQVFAFAAILSTTGAFAALARDHEGFFEGFGGHGHGAPAPEIGASTLGMIMVGGIAIYVRRRRRG